MTSVLELTSLENYYLEAISTPLRLFSVREHCGIGIVRHLYCAVPGLGYSILAARYSPVTSIFDLTKHISLLDVHGSFLSKEVGLGDCEQAHCGAWDWSGKVILPLLLSYIEVTSNFSLDAPPLHAGISKDTSTPVPCRTTHTHWL